MRLISPVHTLAAILLNFVAPFIFYIFSFKPELWTKISSMTSNNHPRTIVINLTKIITQNILRPKTQVICSGTISLILVPLPSTLLRHLRLTLFNNQAEILAAMV